jgi:hypothetical protein
VPDFLVGLAEIRYMRYGLQYEFREKDAVKVVLGVRKLIYALSHIFVRLG